MMLLLTDYITRPIYYIPKNLHNVFHSGCMTMAIPTRSSQGFPFFQILANIIHFIFDNSHSERCDMVCHCGFDLMILVMSDAQHLSRVCWLSVCLP